MTIEVAVLISIVSVAFSVFFGLKSSRRTDASDIETRAREMAEINIKLDHIALGTKEIKEQIASLVRDVQDHGQRITKVEEMAKRNQLETERLHGRIDKLEEKADKEG